MFENLILKNLNADAQEAAAPAETVEATTATPNGPVQTAHDDFDWSVDKRNVTSYTPEEKEKYHKVYDNTFVQLNDGELIKGLVVGMTKTDVVLNIGFINLRCLCQYAPNYITSLNIRVVGSDPRTIWKEQIVGIEKTQWVIHDSFAVKG